MGLFSFFKRKKLLSEEALKWNKMWDMWSDGNVPKEYYALMLYESEVDNGGHAQFFDNTDNCEDLDEVMEGLRQLLPSALLENLERAYAIYPGPVGEYPDGADDILDACDSTFYENEELLIDVLKRYAATLEL